MALFLSVSYYSQGFVMLQGESELSYLDGTKGYPELEFTPRKQSSGVDVTKDCPSCQGLGYYRCGTPKVAGTLPCPTCDTSGKVLVCGKCGKIRLHGKPCENKCRLPGPDKVKKLSEEIAEDLRQTLEAASGNPIKMKKVSDGDDQKEGLKILREYEKTRGWSVCPTCKGFGETSSSGTICPQCDGTGRLYEKDQRKTEKK